MQLDLFFFSYLALFLSVRVLFARDIPFQIIKHTVCHTVLWMLMKQSVEEGCDSRVKAEGKRVTTNTGSYTEVPSQPLLREEKVMSLISLIKTRLQYVRNTPGNKKSS